MSGTANDGQVAVAVVKEANKQEPSGKCPTAATPVTTTTTQNNTTPENDETIKVTPPSATDAAAEDGDGGGDVITKITHGLRTTPPCEHNNWDNVRVKKKVVTLSCRDCHCTWKHIHPIDKLCPDFYSTVCPLGPHCPYLHVHHFKSRTKSPNPDTYVEGTRRDDFIHDCAKEVINRARLERVAAGVIPSDPTDVSLTTSVHNISPTEILDEIEALVLERSGGKRSVKRENFACGLNKGPLRLDGGGEDTSNLENDEKSGEKIAATPPAEKEKQAKSEKAEKKSQPATEKKVQKEEKAAEKTPKAATKAKNEDKKSQSAAETKAAEPAKQQTLAERLKNTSSADSKPTTTTLTRKEKEALERERKAEERKLQKELKEKAKKEKAEKAKIEKEQKKAQKDKEASTKKKEKNQVEKQPVKQPAPKKGGSVMASTPPDSNSPTKMAPPHGFPRPAGEGIKGTLPPGLPPSSSAQAVVTHSNNPYSSPALGSSGAPTPGTMSPPPPLSSSAVQRRFSGKGGSNPRYADPAAEPITLSPVTSSPSLSPKGSYRQQLTSGGAVVPEGVIDSPPLAPAAAPPPGMSGYYQNMPPPSSPFYGSGALASGPPSPAGLGSSQRSGRVVISMDNGPDSPHLGGLRSGSGSFHATPGHGPVPFTGGNNGSFPTNPHALQHGFPLGSPCHHFQQSPIPGGFLPPPMNAGASGVLSPPQLHSPPHGPSAPPAARGNRKSSDSVTSNSIPGGSFASTNMSFGSHGGRSQRNSFHQQGPPPAQQTVATQLTSNSSNTTTTSGSQPNTSQQQNGQSQPQAVANASFSTNHSFASSQNSSFASGRGTGSISHSPSTTMGSSLGAARRYIPQQRSLAEE